MNEEETKSIITININGDMHDFNTMLFSAMRYALGRQTYIVAWTCEFISNNIHLLNEKTIKLMIRDIKEQERFGYGDECDKNDWMQLLKLLEQYNKDKKL